MEPKKTLPFSCHEAVRPDLAVGGPIQSKMHCPPLGNKYVVLIGGRRWQQLAERLLALKDENPVVLAPPAAGVGRFEVAGSGARNGG